jgi:hypothetical protein
VGWWGRVGYSYVSGYVYVDARVRMVHGSLEVGIMEFIRGVLAWMGWDWLAWLDMSLR